MTNRPKKYPLGLEGDHGFGEEKGTRTRDTINEPSTADELSPPAQIAVIFATSSLLICLTAGLVVPLLGAKNGRLDWATVMVDVVGSVIVDDGLTMVGISVALLAAGFVALTISGLSGYSAMVTLKRDALKSIAFAFTATAVVVSTLPAWGIPAGVLRVLFLSSPTEEAVSSASTGLPEELDASFKSIVVGTAAVLTLWCSTELARAISMWIVRDEAEFTSRRRKSLEAQMAREHAAIMRLQRRYSYREIAQQSYGNILLRIVARSGVLAIASLGLMIIVALWESSTEEQRDNTVPFIEGVAGMLAILVLPNVVMPIAAAVPFLIAVLTRTPRGTVENPQSSTGYLAARVLLLTFAAVASIGYPVLFICSWIFGSTQITPYLILIWGIGLSPQLLTWWPGRWGRVDILIAKLARSSLSQQRATTRRELAVLSADDESGSGPQGVRLDGNLTADDQGYKEERSSIGPHDVAPPTSESGRDSGNRNLRPFAEVRIGRVTLALHRRHPRSR